MKLSETVNEVIALGEAIRNYWDAELPKRHPDYPFVREGDDDGPPPPEQKKLEALLASLPEDVIYKLALIMSIGPRRLGKGDLAELYEMLKQRYENPEEAAAHLGEYAALAEDLTDGLAELKRGGMDVDQLTFASVQSGS